MIDLSHSINIGGGSHVKNKPHEPLGFTRSRFKIMVMPLVRNGTLHTDNLDLDAVRAGVLHTVSQGHTVREASERFGISFGRASAYVFKEGGAMRLRDQTEFLQHRWELEVSLLEARLRDLEYEIKHLRPLIKSIKKLAKFE